MFSFDFSHYKEDNSNTNLSYNDIYLSLKDEKIYFQSTEYKIVLSKIFFESSRISKLEENLF